MSGNASAPGGHDTPFPTGAAAASPPAALRAAACRGDAIAQHNLAVALLSSGGPADAVEAAGWLRRAAEGGIKDAMTWLCTKCFHGAPGVPVDKVASYLWAVRGGEAGSAKCQFAAGLALLRGIGVAMDETAAARWFRRAADAGYAAAQWSLYTCHGDGKGGLRPDDTAMMAYLRAAAEGGSADAQRELSRLLRDGIGVPADAAAANVWGLRAAEGGSIEAQTEMGHRLLYGHGIPCDSVLGVALLRRGADAGSLLAGGYLGDAHAAGLGGLAVDLDAARALFERATACEDAESAATARRRLHALASCDSRDVVPALPTLVPPVCGHSGCGAAMNAGTLSGLCGGCRAVRYCGGGCQRAAWAGHRAACQAASARRAAAAAAVTPSSAVPASLSGAASATLAAQREETEMWRRMPLDALLQAAERGTAAAQSALGVAYIGGTLGLDEDIDTGLGWLRKAAAQGQLQAREQLGQAAAEEAAVPGSDAAALLTAACEWYRPLAEAGDAAAQHNLFVCCLRRGEAGGGAAAAALYTEAGRWLRAAAAQKMLEAVNALGKTAWYGDARLGVARDRRVARRLFAAADAAGLPLTQRADRPAGAPGSTESA